MGHDAGTSLPDESIPIRYDRVVRLRRGLEWIDHDRERRGEAD
jgi:hypothetical protein